MRDFLVADLREFAENVSHRHSVSSALYHERRQRGHVSQQEQEQAPAQETKQTNDEMVLTAAKIYTETFFHLPIG
jgi:hypothetical protein